MQVGWLHGRPRPERRIDTYKRTRQSAERTDIPLDENDGVVPPSATRPVIMSHVKYAEDLAAGELIDLGSHTVTEAELVSFATQWDPQDFHTDRRAAQHSYFGGLIASGIHSIAVLQRLSVDAMYRHFRVLGGRGLRDVRFLRPVRPGDTLTGEMHIDDIILDNRERALVISTGRLQDPEGRPVLDMVVEAYLHRRPEGV